MGGVIGALTTGMIAYNVAQAAMTLGAKLHAAASITEKLAILGVNTAMLTSPITWVVAGIDVPTAFTLIDYRSTGKGIAFGKVSEKDALEVSIDTDFKKQVNVYSPNTGVADGAFLRLRVTPK